MVLFVRIIFPFLQRTAVLKWQQPETEMVAYRSFSPFFPLLSDNEHEVQLWAVWAILHVCTKNGKIACKLGF